jgi:uncharacterized membrane protein YphA (DoxX/SURF4 family)
MATLSSTRFQAGGLRTLSILMGVFLLFMGVTKAGWLMDSEPLASRLREWLETAPPASRWYLETIALPGAPVFARLVLVGELAAGAALVAGFQVRLAAALALLMVLNFHFAADVLFHYSYLTNPYGLPVLGGLLALVIGGARLPFGLSK